MNYNENKTKSKNVIKKNFLKFFIIQNSKHLASHKLKEIRKNHKLLVRKYDKRVKYLLSQISQSYGANDY